MSGGLTSRPIPDFGSSSMESTMSTYLCACEACTSIFCCKTPETRLFLTTFLVNHIDISDIESSMKSAESNQCLYFMRPFQMHEQHYPLLPPLCIVVAMSSVKCGESECVVSETLVYPFLSGYKLCSEGDTSYH